MKRRLFGERQKSTKGMPSAVLLSILIHIGLFLLAGWLVVFTVVKQKEVEFAPPKAVERPKMKLKKPKVRIKKSSKPRPTTRIVTKVQKASMPDIQLPEISGIAEGLAGGDVGFDLMPDLGETTLFGSGQSIGNDFEGTLYDFKRDRQGRKLLVAMDIANMYKEIGLFIRSGWKASRLARFYRSPQKLYSPTIMIPPTLSQFAPLAFDEPEMGGDLYMLHYKGQLVSREGGRFRFWGMGDNFLVVRVDGQVVLDCANQFSLYWKGPRSKETSYHLGHWPAWSGQWIDLKPGVPKEMEVIFGEADGGLFAAMLVVEQEGVEYPRNMEQGPMLPVFKTAELTRDQVETIFADLPPDRYSVTNGPVFCDYAPPPMDLSVAEPAAVAAKPATVPPNNGLRTWTLKGGEVVEAKYVMQMGDKTILENANGRQVKVPSRDLSTEDQDYLELVNPPPLKISLLKDESRFHFPDVISTAPIPKLTRITIGVKIEQLNSKPYGRKLKLELFSIASEIDGNNFVLLDRQETTFSLTKENGRSFVFWGKPAEMRDYQDWDGNRRGRRFKGYMAVVTDERGVVVAKSMTNDWFFDIIESLRTLPVTRHFDKTGKRVYPPRAKVIMTLW